ncbi:hypothetical protein [Devosia sp.]|jgi:hypothetical protein|uniref:hypothetical protein n=1 Tax=Devosia sp. TaxID=1871048 RepID=UPI001AC69FC7|nr:hypothetical protein [Devosia sp.]MBN9336139.1 hypothetical protein [Devosia sp.]
MTISAGEAGDAMATIAATLERHNVVESEGYAVLQRLARELKLKKDATAWSVEVDRGAPILFRRTTDEKGRWLKPRVVAKGIEVEQGDGTALPFRALDIALEVDDDTNGSLSRWHLDLANKTAGVSQSGPVTHLQFGGHNHGDREHDHKLKVPRWCHPPMEVALLCEVVAANFYEEEWLGLRDEPNWCQAICLYQQLCYKFYFERMANSLSVSSSTALSGMWASTYS